MASVILAGVIFTLVLSMLVKWLVLPAMGLPWPFRRVSIPWRFSLFSVTVLVALAAIVLALFRDSLDATLLSLSLVLAVWLTVVRYLAFRRSVSDRSQRALTTMLDEQKGQDADSGSSHTRST
jgi:hypothetical protein